jgi:NAD(P)-dependent dehydrogenase (short-subunit alcohol dehydrogenase family)
MDQMADREVSEMKILGEEALARESRSRWRWCRSTAHGVIEGDSEGESRSARERSKGRAGRERRSFDRVRTCGGPRELVRPPRRATGVTRPPQGHYANPRGPSGATERRTGTLLEGKNAIIYGGGGNIGGAVAREFAREGANVFLAGRTRETLEAVANDIGAAGGFAEVAVLDALDEKAVDEHARDVVSRSGGIDVSFSLITRGDVQGVPLVDMTPDDLLRAVVGGLRSNFLTALAAARRMIEQGSGVILALDSASATGSPMMGSTGPADAATDVFIRNLAAEIGPHGVRFLGIWTAGLPETFSREKLAAVDSRFEDEAALEGLIEGLDAMRMTRRSPRLAEVAATAAFLASEKAGAITGTFVNATSGTFPS